MLIDITTRLANIPFPLRCITAKEAMQEISSNHGLLLDVREPAEAASSPVEAALNIPPVSYTHLTLPTICSV